eukprot:scpid73343/ scgid33718/ Sphingomyelin phosphodiesterase 2; Lyso-platelet-activating factor-phospholipase C; Neutral sphingomyelinase
MSTMKIKVLSLNFWNIPFFGLSKDRSQRLKALAELLLKEKYDVVTLQEVWCEDGHDYLKEKCGAVYPHTKYFARGVIGSGLLVLSRYAIYDTLFASYAPNGHPQKLNQGDFYGGKGVGLCRIDADGRLLDVYTTHLIAAYAKDLSNKDSHAGHRMAQMVQLMQFVRNTRRPDATQLVTGDLNTMPFEPSLKVLLEGTPLHDAWLATHDGEEGGFTCITSDNVYSGKDPVGPKRIDYILFSDPFAKCLSCDVSLCRVPNDTICYSDHDGVVACLEISPPEQSAAAKSRTSAASAPIPGKILTLASDCLVECVGDAKASLQKCLFRLVITLVLLVLMLVFAPACTCVTIICSVNSFAVAFLFFMYAINRSEVNELNNVISALKIQQQHSDKRR